MNSPRELLQFDFNASTFARRALRSIEIPQNNLEDLEEISENHGDRGTEMPNREDLCQVYRLFITAHGTERLRTGFDTLSRVRKLAWALIYCENQPPFDERIVDNTSQLSDALGLIEDHFCISALRGGFRCPAASVGYTEYREVTRVCQKASDWLRGTSDVCSKTESKYDVVLRGERCDSACDDAATFTGKTIGSLVIPWIA